MRHPRDILLEAELMASSPERVYDWLKSRTSQEALKLEPKYDEEIDNALLSRHEQLINLALARFSQYPKTVRGLFESTDTTQRTSLRLASLSNTQIEKGFSAMPESLYGESILVQGDVRIFMSGLSDEELWALFANPSLSDSFVTDFLEHKESWEALTEVRQQIAIAAFAENLRIEAEYEGMMDGFAEYSHGAVFNAAWLLADKVPVTPRWAVVLGKLFHKLRREAFSIKDPLEHIGRWQPPDSKSQERECEGINDGYLPPFAQVRKGLARLACDSRGAAAALVDHEDPAVRAAAYADGVFTVEMMQKAFERDRALALQEMMFNDNLWRNAETRKLLHDMAWEGAKGDRGDLDDANLFNAVAAGKQKKHPEWFRDSDDILEDPAPKPATTEELAEISQELLTVIRTSHQQSIGQLSKRATWILAGVVAIILILLWN